MDRVETIGSSSRAGGPKRNAPRTELRVIPYFNVPVSEKNIFDKNQTFSV